MDRPPATTPFDAWFTRDPAELVLLRRAVQEWLTDDCALNPEVSRDVVLAVHEAVQDCLNEPMPGRDDGVAVHAEYDGDEVAVMFVASAHAQQPPLGDPGRRSTRLVLHLVDEAEVEARDDTAQVCLRRYTR